MYRVSDFIRRFALALLLGSLIATIWVNLSPATYYDTMEARLMPLPFPSWFVADHVRVTLISLVTDGAMALFFFLLGKELWEANVLERGALQGRRGGLPLLASAGAVVGAVTVWVLVSVLLETAEEAVFGTGWAVPIGGDAIISYAVGRFVFGRRSAALHLLLLITIGTDLVGLVALAFLTPAEPWRLIWLVLPVLALAGAWYGFGRYAAGRTERERQEALHLAPYIIAGIISWAGVTAAGLPGALGLLPVIPAIPHARRAFGLFADAEKLLHDPLNRLANLAMKPLVGVLFLFGLTRGGVDLAAFAPTTIVLLMAFWIGRPLGLLAGALIAVRVLRFRLPRGVSVRDIVRIAALMGFGFTVPLVAIDSALPGGAMAEAARLGLALTLLLAPLTYLLMRKNRPAATAVTG